ncbi:MAG: hypothetical protein KBA05_06930 [Anaerolineaceae bacterium]|jgi:hypothetical protein|nr:hypothetical protein [Anaerolineaceae bacterium]MDI9531017.1 hypothetical protein [Chloroflexota bacterium]NLE93996.1 hypothetical protein [Chloroflexota bacterium]HNZ15929.1 hypothetical protein [Anaerolineaceae bacterium]HOF28533.1 hypothetical protein [Anaerolineaceae bacterium]
MTGLAVSIIITVKAGEVSGNDRKSIDAGASWLSYNSGILYTSVDSVSIHPEDSTILYAILHLTGIYSTKTWDYATYLPSVFK